MDDFIVQNRIDEQHAIDVQHARPCTVLDVLYRCLDRHLRMGLSTQSLRRFLSSKEPTHYSPAALFLSELYETGCITRMNMPVALARSWDAATCPPTSSAWYASRKLDGVRCVAVIGCAPPSRIQSVHLLSRTGRNFGSLRTLQDAFAKVLEACPHMAKTQLGPESKPMTWVLDGELCVIDETQTPFRESFVRAMSQLQQHPSSTDECVATDLVYFPFDMLTLDEFTMGAKEIRRYSARLAHLQRVVSWVHARHPRAPIRALPQVRIDAQDTLDRMLRDAAHWEGIMLREDMPYEGRRTHSMRKIRPKREGEYLVRDIEIRTMRLALDGTYADRHALASMYMQKQGKGAPCCDETRARLT